MAHRVVPVKRLPSTSTTMSLTPSGGSTLSGSRTSWGLPRTLTPEAAHPRLIYQRMTLYLILCPSTGLSDLIDKDAHVCGGLLLGRFTG